jgi:hypothetical protein
MTTEGCRMLERTKERKFLLDEFWIFAWNASVQRVRLYEENSLPTPERQSFRLKLRNIVDAELLPHYRISCSELKHYESISTVVELGSASGKSVLSSRGYGYGIAQKLLNLYLKYCWCAGYVGEPPHCAIDRIILSKTRFRDRLNWTTMSEAQYRDGMSEISTLARAQGLTPARWELENHLRR